jgi:mannose-6-phosphate isomerase-like protein (cupin superfamily)
VLQAREITLIVTATGTNVARRGRDGNWRYAIALLNGGPTESQSHSRRASTNKQRPLPLQNGNQNRRTIMTTTAQHGAVLDFNPTVGMVVEGSPPADPATDPWRVTMTFAPGFGGPPLHLHPNQEESYQVQSGVLDVFIDGHWREVRPGERVTVPAGTPHTIRNLHPGEMRAINVHAPALDFPHYMASLHELTHNGKVRALPPKDPRSAIYLSMLFTAHKQSLVSVKPPQRLMRILAFIGRRLGYRLPA